MQTQAPPPDQVKAALDELLGWSEVARSPQLAKFLKHIVEAKLRGEENNIKAYSIAVDVFGRPATFDPQADPIVRVQARRLRGLLQEFYRQNLARSTARITLPVGRYVPEFESLTSGEPAPVATAEPVAALVQAPEPIPVAPNKVRFGKHFWLQGLAAMGLVLVLGLVLIALQLLRNSPIAPVILPVEPTVLISTFKTEGESPQLALFSGRFSEKLGALFAQFEDSQVGYADDGQIIPPSDSTFVLAGMVTAKANSLEIAAHLNKGSDGDLVWSSTFTVPLPGNQEDAVISMAAKDILREVGPFRSAVHAAGRHWLDEHTGALPAVNSYVCLLLYRYARESGESGKIAQALACNDRLLADKPDSPLNLAAEAWLQNTVIVNEAGPTDDLGTLLARPAELAMKARDLAPESSFAYEQLGVVRHWQGRFGEAQQNFAIALGFQSLNTDARAAYAISLARTHDWEQAAEQSRMALADSSMPPPWYYYPIALKAFRDGRYDDALADARITAKYSSGEIGVILAVASAALAGRAADAAEFAPLVMSKEHLRRNGIIPWFSIRASDPIILERLATGLAAGGIPESALTRPF